MVKAFSKFFKVFPLIISCRLIMRIQKIMWVRLHNVPSERLICTLSPLPPIMATGLSSTRVAATGTTTTTTTTTTAAVCVS